MGNIEFKDAYRRISEDNFDTQGLEQNYGHLIFRKPRGDSERAKFEDMCFGHSLERKDLDKLFKTMCAVDQSEIRELEAGQAEERFRDEVLKDVSIGYTTSESKLNQLKQGGKL